MPRTKEIFARLDALERIVLGTDDRFRPIQEPPADSRDGSLTWDLIKQKQTLLSKEWERNTLLKDEIKRLEAEIALLSANNKEITNALIKSGSEVALRGERLEEMYADYQVRLDCFDKDGKYISEVGNGVKKKTCKCRVHYSMLDNGATCKSCGRIVEVSDE